MAVSAFKSTSKRSNATSTSTTATTTNTSAAVSSIADRPIDGTNKKMPFRRSRSVSAVSRAHRSKAPPPSSSSASDMPEFLNKRDNPLFSCSATTSSSGSPEPDNPLRGRPATRSSGSASRSVSRIGAARRVRSVSRGHYRNSESDVDHGHRLASSAKRSKEFDVTKETKNLQTWSSRHPVNDTWDTASSYTPARNWEDGISASSISEPEETVIRMVVSMDKSDSLALFSLWVLLFGFLAYLLFLLQSFQSGHPSSDNGIYETVRSEVQRAVCEIRNDLENAIRRKNSAIITVDNVLDIPRGLVNPDAIELVPEIRRDYATKLEQSQKRARKLREDLAVEEQCGQELNRILKEMLPDPNCSETRTSRPRRKASMERLKMSQRLAEEAMNYFDECVSISTFDSSDFSSQEEPLPSSVAGVPPMASSRYFPNEGTTYSVEHFPSIHLDHHEESDDQTQCSVSFTGSELGVSSNCSDTRVANLMHASGSHDDLVGFSKTWGGSFPFSFACEPMESGVHDIRHYIKKFEKERRKEGMEYARASSSYNPDDYDQTSAESLLFDKLIFRNRIESGGLLICDIRIF